MPVRSRVSTSTVARCTWLVAIALNLVATPGCQPRCYTPVIGFGGSLVGAVGPREIVSHVVPFASQGAMNVLDLSGLAADAGDVGLYVTEFECQVFVVPRLIDIPTLGQGGGGPCTPVGGYSSQLNPPARPPRRVSFSLPNFPSGLRSSAGQYRVHVVGEAGIQGTAAYSINIRWMTGGRGGLCDDSVGLEILR